MRKKSFRSLVNPKGNARNLKCPCGSGKKYKNCHLSQYLNFKKYQGSNLLGSGESSNREIRRWEKQKKQSFIERDFKIEVKENQVNWNFGYWSERLNLYINTQNWKKLEVTINKYEEFLKKKYPECLTINSNSISKNVGIFR